MRRRILSRHHTTKQRYPNATSPRGGVTSNQEYGWYGSMGGHVVMSQLFHKPIRKTFATEYVDSYNITHGVNPFHLKSATDRDIGALVGKKM